MSQINRIRNLYGEGRWRKFRENWKLMRKLPASTLPWKISHQKLLRNPLGRRDSIRHSTPAMGDLQSDFDRVEPYREELVPRWVSR
jgi:hypothetical protein